MYSFFKLYYCIFKIFCILFILSYQDFHIVVARGNFLFKLNF